MALSAAVRKAVWTKEFGKLLGIYKTGPMLILGDSTVANGMARESKLTDASKHIEVQYHYVREVVKNKRVEIKHVASEENTADLLTKALGKVLHEKHVHGMGMRMKSI